METTEQTRPDVTSPYLQAITETGKLLFRSDGDLRALYKSITMNQRLVLESKAAIRESITVLQKANSIWRDGDRLSPDCPLFKVSSDDLANNSRPAPGQSISLQPVPAG